MIVEVFRFLNRFDLDSAQTTCRLFSEIVAEHGQTLSRRTICLAQLEREPAQLRFEPEKITFEVQCQRALHGRFLVPGFGPQRLYDDDESLTTCLAFLKGSNIRELRLHLQVDERALSLMKHELVDVSIDQLIVRSAGSTSSTIRKLITSTFPGRLRSVYFDVVPDQRRYYSSDLSNHLLVSAAENGVDGFYTPRILPIDQFAYDIDVNAVVDFCLRRRPCRGHRVFGGSFLKIIAPDLSRFLWASRPIDHFFHFFMNDLDVAPYMLALQASGIEMIALMDGSWCSRVLHPLPLQVHVLPALGQVAIFGGKPPRDGKRYFIDIPE